MNFWHPSSRLKFHSMTIVSLSNRVSPGLFEDVFSRSRVSIRLLINSIFAIVRCLALMWRSRSPVRLAFCQRRTGVLYTKAIRQA